MFFKFPDREPKTNPLEDQREIQIFDDMLRHHRGKT